MYIALERTCANCHRNGSTPYFASGTSFYRLLISDPAWVVPGKPDQSALIDLLLGKAKGQYKQMPLGTKNYDVLSKEGKTNSSLDEVRTFITDLEGCTPEAAKPVEKVWVQRKSAQQIFNTLKLHIGVEDADIRTSGNPREENYPIWNPDRVPRVSDGVNFSSFGSGAAQRWHALGGQSYLRNIRATRALTPTFGQTIVQVSQAWCRMGVQKTDNSALFKFVTQDDLASATDTQIKKNIKYLMLRFWGHDASDEEVETMFSTLYIPILEKRQSHLGGIQASEWMSSVSPQTPINNLTVRTVESRV